MHTHKKGFTLTEVLMAVLIVATLSAVVLPKYKKVLESVRVGEAERMMAAVRNEQVARCALNKQYTTNTHHLGVFPDAATGSTYTTSNFVYDLTPGNGMTATSNSESGYVFEMPSYQDGRICCDNCSTQTQSSYLNKNYPTCDELQADDFQAEDGTCYPL